MLSKLTEEKSAIATQLLVLVIIVTGLVVSSLLVQQNQDLFPAAQVSTTISTPSSSPASCPYSCIPNLEDCQEIDSGTCPTDYVCCKKQKLGSTPSATSTLESSSQCQISGNGNTDCSINGIDYVIWINNYGITNATGPSQGDYNDDQAVNGVDYVVWLNNYTG